MTTTIKKLPVPAVTGSLESYISSVNQIPVLTVEEERSLADKVRDHEDIDAAIGSESIGPAHSPLLPGVTNVTAPV